jgi:hypothetical protein
MEIMKTHDLKIYPIYFKDVFLNLKQFEVRLNDRDYQEGDNLNLREWDPVSETYTGLTVKRKIFNIYQNLPGLQPGFVIMQIRPLIK